MRPSPVSRVVLPPCHIGPSRYGVVLPALADPAVRANRFVLAIESCCRIPATRHLCAAWPPGGGSLASLAGDPWATQGAAASAGAASGLRFAAVEALAFGGYSRRASRGFRLRQVGSAGDAMAAATPATPFGRSIGPPPPCCCSAMKPQGWRRPTACLQPPRHLPHARRLESLNVAGGGRSLLLEALAPANRRECRLISSNARTVSFDFDVI